MLLSISSAVHIPSSVVRDTFPRCKSVSYTHLSSKTPSIPTSCPIIQNYFCHDSPTMILYEESDQELWSSKLEEIRTFQREGQDQRISMFQAEDLIDIYNRYRHVFSNAPGKVKDYQCKIEFKEPVDFHKKSYPIAYSLKNEVRAEINRMMEDDIIEFSQSPYTLSLIHI